jgi:hypothetical protein
VDTATARSNGGPNEFGAGGAGATFSFTLTTMPKSTRHSMRSGSPVCSPNDIVK